MMSTSMERALKLAAVTGLRCALGPALVAQARHRPERQNLALAALGIVTPQMLSRFRKHAAVAVVIVSAFLTPGDLITTTIAMAVPLYMLYEISLALSFIIYRRRERAIATAGDA